MSWRQDIVNIARSQLGIAESPPHSNSGPAGKYQIMPDGTERAVPWCAYFAIWCYNQASVLVPGNPWRLGAVNYLEKVCREKGQLRPHQESPKPGDIIFFANRGGSDKGRGRHCGIVERVIPERGRVVCIEGNIGNKVARRYHKLKSKRISGYGWI